MTPDDLLFTKEHEWLRLVDETGIIGISDHAQKELGEIVYIELPKVGTKFGKHDVFGTIEAVKAVSELFAPIAGEVLAINERLDKEPALVNTDPYGAGWMIKLRVKDAGETAALLDSAAYAKHVGE